MEQYIKKTALVAEIEKRMQELRPTNTHQMQVGEKMDRDVLMCLNALTWVKNLLDTLEVKEYSEEYDGFLGKELKMVDDEINRLERLKVKEVELDFQTFAKEMDTVFNLPSSETKNTEEEPLNWEYAIAKCFFELGLKAKDWKNERMKECPFRQDVCNRYKGTQVKCDGRCSWVVDYPKLKEFKAQKGE